jgi:Mg2+/Co2+ transporter CorB
MSDTSRGTRDLLRGNQAVADQAGAGNDESTQFVSKTLDSALKRSRRGQRLWSFANHGATISIVVFSAAAAVMSQTAVKFWNDDPKAVATILSLAVTVIATLQSTLGFERKWIANRMTRNSLRRLQIDEKTGAGSQQVKERLKAILEEHDRAITAGSG